MCLGSGLLIEQLRPPGCSSRNDDVSRRELFRLALLQAALAEVDRNPPMILTYGVDPKVAVSSDDLKFLVLLSCRPKPGKPGTADHRYLRGRKPWTLRAAGRCGDGLWEDWGLVHRWIPSSTRTEISLSRRVRPRRAVAMAAKPSAAETTMYQATASLL